MHDKNKYKGTFLKKDKKQIVSNAELDIANQINPIIRFSKKQILLVKTLYFKTLGTYVNNKSFLADLKLFNKMNKFKVSENVWTQGITINQGIHCIMRGLSTIIMSNLFEDFLKIDHNDPNVAGSITDDNIGTAGRVIKMLTGKDLNDTKELMSGRWTKPPRMARFPAKENEQGNPVFVKSRLDAVCSHHFVPFNDMSENAYCVVGYIPEKYVGGISKINRFVEWVGARGWLQEDLTEIIANTIKERFKTKSVYVCLKNIKHGCASSRGIKDRNASTSTVIATGVFKESNSLIPSEFR